MSGRKQKVWVWLTLQRIDAVLAVAAMIDAKPESLEAVLPGARRPSGFSGSHNHHADGGRRDGRGEQMNGGHYRMQSDVPRPSAVVIMELAGRAFMVQGYRTGVSIYARAEDAWRLREALDAIFAGDSIHECATDCEADDMALIVLNHWRGRQ